VDQPGEQLQTRRMGGDDSYVSFCLTLLPHTHPLPMRELMPVYAYTRLTTFHSEHCSASHV